MINRKEKHIFLFLNVQGSQFSPVIIVKTVMNIESVFNANEVDMGIKTLANFEHFFLFKNVKVYEPAKLLSL